MENRPLEIADTEQAKELFEHETTEILYALRDELNSTSDIAPACRSAVEAVEKVLSEDVSDVKKNYNVDGSMELMDIKVTGKIFENKIIEADDVKSENQITLSLKKSSLTSPYTDRPSVSADVEMPAKISEGWGQVVLSDQNHQITKTMALNDLEVTDEAKEKRRNFRIGLPEKNLLPPEATRFIIKKADIQPVKYDVSPTTDAPAVEFPEIVFPEKITPPCSEVSNFEMRYPDLSKLSGKPCAEKVVLSSIGYADHAPLFDQKNIPQEWHNISFDYGVEIPELTASPVPVTVAAEPATVSCTYIEPSPEQILQELDTMKKEIQQESHVPSEAISEIMNMEFAAPDISFEIKEIMNSIEKEYA